jgi:hypothetical protein
MTLGLELLALVVIACLGTIAFFGGAKGHPKPYSHPKVTSLEARRRLLAKAEREQTWWAENARG